MAASELVEVVAAIHLIWMRTNHLLGEVLEEHGLTTATFQALWAIDPDAPPPSMKVMAERIFCNAPNLSFITNQLVERGFVERSVGPDDRRSRVLVLTDKGRRVRIAAVRAAAEQSPLAELGDGELRRLLVLLDRAVPAD
ncbi:MarR family winged helix-turn-helix transcriptional regulator [Mycobacterium sp. NPDC003449]